jgi:hypothetical protein
MPTIPQVFENQLFAEQTEMGEKLSHHHLGISRHFIA